jgi:hypothetical protein
MISTGSLRFLRHASIADKYTKPFENLLDMWDERMITTIVNSKRKEMIQIAFPVQLSEDLDYRAFSRSCTGKPFD